MIHAWGQLASLIILGLIIDASASQPLDCKRNDYLSIYYGRSMTVCAHPEDENVANIGDKLSSKMIVPTHIWSLALTVLNMVSHVALSDSSSKSRMPHYRDHPCTRECDDDSTVMTCEYDFTIEYYYTLTQACFGCPFNVTDCFRPHCVTADGISRGVMTVNRMLPGPSIRVCEGDTIVVNVKNMMEGGEGTAIHWHGILQSETPFMDGVAMLTQCPIHHHSKFQYKFKADTPGTHYWHAHAGLQRADGVFGSLVIRQTKAREYHSALYDHDLAEHTILLNDWLDEMSATRFAGHHHAMTEHLPKSILINGRGTKKEFSIHQEGKGHGGHGGHMMMENSGSHNNHMMQEMQHNDMSQMQHNEMSTMQHSEMPSLQHPEMQTMQHNGMMSQQHADMSQDSFPTSNPELQHMNNGENDIPNGMDTLTTLSHAELETLVNQQMHQMRKRSTSETVTMPTSSDDNDKPKQTETKTFTPHAVFTVQHGGRYRFRVASNGINNCPINFSVDNHTITVISSDGTPFKPVQVQSFNIFAGERYDFVLHAHRPIGNYWIRTQGLADCGPQYKSARQTAILRYEGALPILPAESTDYQNDGRHGMKLNPFNKNSDSQTMNVDRLDSLIPDDHSLKVKPDRQFYLAMDFNLIENYRFNDPDFYPLQPSMAQGAHAHHMFSPQINHISYSMPPSPPLSQYSKDIENHFCDEYSFGEKDCKKEFCECTHRLKVNLGEVVEIVMVDEGKHMDNNHPMHMHGYHFRVVAMEKLGNRTSLGHVRLLDDMGLINRKLHRAISKDTVTVPDGGYTIIRFHATNPGFWLFHCHIAFHMEMGMSLVIQVGEPEQMPPSPPHFPKCGDWTPYEQSLPLEVAQKECPPPPMPPTHKPTTVAPTTTTMKTTTPPPPTIPVTDTTVSTTSSAVTTPLPPLQQIYLGGIQQTTDVNLKDVTLHYALLVWMTGKKKNKQSSTQTLISDIIKGKNKTVGKSRLIHRKGKNKNKTTKSGHRKKLPILNINSAKLPGGLSKSSMIELSNLPKMIVPAHYIKKIISKKPSSSGMEGIPKSHKLSERVSKISSNNGSINKRNMSLHFVEKNSKAGRKGLGRFHSTPGMKPLFVQSKKSQHEIRRGHTAQLGKHRSMITNGHQSVQHRNMLGSQIVPQNIHRNEAHNSLSMRSDWKRRNMLSKRRMLKHGISRGKRHISDTHRSKFDVS